MHSSQLYFCSLVLPAPPDSPHWEPVWSGLRWYNCSGGAVFISISDYFPRALIRPTLGCWSHLRYSSVIVLAQTMRHLSAESCHSFTAPFITINYQPLPPARLRNTGHYPRVGSYQLEESVGGDVVEWDCCDTSRRWCCYWCCLSLQSPQCVDNGLVNELWQGTSGKWSIITMDINRRPVWGFIINPSDSVRSR